jgi:hypothetical protein
MDIGGFFKPKSKVGLHHTYGLTPLGKVKAEKHAEEDGGKWAVLNCLNDDEASSISEISESTKIKPEKVKAILKTFIGNGYVRRVSQEN